MLPCRLSACCLRSCASPSRHPAFFIRYSLNVCASLIVVVHQTGLRVRAGCSVAEHSIIGAYCGWVRLKPALFPSVPPDSVAPSCALLECSLLFRVCLRCFGHCFGPRLRPEPVLSASDTASRATALCCRCVAVSSPCMAQVGFELEKSEMFAPLGELDFERYARGPFRPSCLNGTRQSGLSLAAARLLPAARPRCSFCLPFGLLTAC